MCYITVYILHVSKAIVRFIYHVPNYNIVGNRLNNQMYVFFRKC